MRRTRVTATARLRSLYRAHHQAAIRNIPVGAVLEAAAATPRPVSVPRQASSPLDHASVRPLDANPPRVVIVGAGLAGIRCAHMLWTQEPAIASTVYEASDRIGGRCWSLRHFFDDGLTAEHGGSFINSDEHAIRDLARSLGLEEKEVDGGDLSDSGPEVFWIDGSIYSYAEANDDWAAVGYRAFRTAAARARWPQTYRHHSAEGHRLDQLNSAEWLDDCGIGASSRFGRLMLQSVMSEFGGDPEEQSALNLISLLGGSNPKDSLDPVPGYDEKFSIAGGNDQIATRMLEQLPSGTIQHGHRLVRVSRNADQGYTCVFETGGGTVEAVADYLVLTLPFRMLRDVDLADAAFSPLKMRAINELGFGSIGKIHVQLSSKPWVALNYAGGAYSDPESFGVVWDDSVDRGRSGTPALMSIYPAGHVADRRLTLPVSGAHGLAPAGDVGWFFNEIEQIYPGVGAAFMGKAYEDNWTNSPYARGALAFWKVGQVTGFSGCEGEREGRALFAGEHTNRQEPGFMNSAIVSGERAARAIRAEM